MTGMVAAENAPVGSSVIINRLNDPTMQQRVFSLNLIANSHRPTRHHSIVGQCELAIRHLTR